MERWLRWRGLRQLARWLRKHPDQWRHHSVELGVGDSDEVDPCPGELLRTRLDEALSKKPPWETE